MKIRFPGAIGLAAILLLAACGQQPSAPADTSDASDLAGLDATAPLDVGLPGLDASSVDSGTETRPDATAVDSDASEARDAGEPPDAAADLDASEPPDASAPLDAGEPPDATAGPDASAGLDASGSADGSLLIRVMAANLSSGSGQSYDPGEGLRLIAGAHPDIVLIQEFNYGGNSDATLQKMVTDTLGPDFTFCRDAKGALPNGILSRWHIATCSAWTDPKVSNRAFTYARIALPGARELWAVSLHLLTSSSAERGAEAVSLVKSIQGTVPAGANLTVGGDLNTGSPSEACVTTLGAVVVTPGSRPVDQKGNSNTSGNRSKPHDYVFASPPLDAAQVPTAIGSSTFPRGLVLDSRVYAPLSEIAPVQQGDSGASGMQHMGVLKDFLVP